MVRPIVKQGVQAVGDRSHKVPAWLEPLEEGHSGELADSHNIVVEKLAAVPKEYNT